MPRAVNAKPDDIPPWAEGLADRERRFVEEYLVDLSATDATVRAGIGKTRKSATEIACRLRRKQSVATAISRIMSERAGATGSRVIEELGKLAFADLTDIVKVKGGFVVVTDTEDLTPDQRAAIAEISETISEHGRTVKVKLHDKIAALNKLAKVLSLYKERVELSGPNGGGIPVDVKLAGVRERISERLSEIEQRLNVEPILKIQPPPRRVAAPPANVFF